MLVREVLFQAIETAPGALWLPPQAKRPFTHDDLFRLADAEGWLEAEAEGYAPGPGEPIAFWKFRDDRVFRLCIPQVLKIDGAPQGSHSAAKAIARADERLAPILYGGEYMLYAWRDGEEPLLISVEYWMQTRAAVFQQVAEARREAREVEEALEEADDGDGIDQTITAAQLEPDTVIYLVEKPFPGAYLKRETLQ